MATKVEKKITVKGVCGAIKLQKLMAGLSDDAVTGPSIPLMSLIGIARRYKVVPTDKGESIKFLGSFKAVNLATGEETVSGACFLPGAIPDLIFGALGDSADREVEFAFRISAHFDSSAITKYVYDVESLIPVSEADPLKQLERAMTANLLESKPDASKAPEPEPAPEQSPGAKKSSKK